MPGKSAIALVLIGLALVVGLAACGSDDDDSSAGEGTTTQVTEPATTEETTTEETTTDETTTGDDDGAAQESKARPVPGSRSNSGRTARTSRAFPPGPTR